MRTAFLLPLLCLACSPVASANEEAGSVQTDQARIGRATIVLTSTGDRCTAVDAASGRRIDMGIAGPCRFMRNKGRAEALTFAYPKVGTVAVVTGAPSEETRAGFPAAPLSEQCSFYARGLIVASSGAARPSVSCRRPPNSSLHCPNGGLDEKDFWGFAHDTRASPSACP